MFIISLGLVYLSSVFGLPLPCVAPERLSENGIKFQNTVVKDVKIVAAQSGAIAVLQPKCYATLGNMNIIPVFAALRRVIHPVRRWLFKWGSNETITIL